MIRAVISGMFWSVVAVTFAGVIIIGLPITWSLFVAAVIGLVYFFSEAAYEAAEAHYSHPAESQSANSDTEMPIGTPAHDELHLELDSPELPPPPGRHTSDVVGMTRRP